MLSAAGILAGLALFGWPMREIPSPDSQSATTEQPRPRETVAEVKFHADAELADLRKRYGAEHPKLVERCLSLAEQALQGLDLARAEAAAREAVRIAEKLPRTQEGKLPEALKLLGQVLRQRGQLDEALRLAQQGVALADGPTRLSAIYRQEAFNALGLTYLAMNRLDEAEEALQQALKTHSTTPSLPSLTTAETWETLGQVHLGQAKNERALVDFTEALLITETWTGTKSVPYARRLGRLAVANFRVKSLAEAEKLARQAVELLTPRRPESPGELAVAEIELARILVATKKLPEAALHFQKGREILERLPGREASVPVAGFEQAKVLAALNQLPEAETLLRRSLEYRSQQTVTNQWALADLYRELGEVLAQRHALPQAEEALQQSLSLARALQDVTRIGQSELALARLRRAERRPVEAEVFYRQALAAQEQALGLTSPALTPLLLEFGAYCVEINNRAEAQRMLDRAKALQSQKSGPAK